MLTLVSNTSPVIALAKLGRLSLLKELYGIVIIPPFVKGECVDKGKAIGAQEVYEIERGIREGWMKVVSLERKLKVQVRNLMRHTQIGPGEAEALILAKAKRIPVILDDAEARAVARSLEIEHRGTVMVFYEAFVRRIVSYEDLVKLLTNLSKVMWVSPAVIFEILRKAEEVRK